LGKPTIPGIELDQAVAKQAVARVGTNGLPFLVSWIQYEPSPWKPGVKLAALLRHLPGQPRLSALGRVVDRPADEWRARGSKQAFQILGAAASPAIPQLAALVNPTNGARVISRSVEALGGIGPPALPAMIDLLAKQPDRVVRLYLLYGIANLGTNARPAAPALFACLGEGDGMASSAAAYALGAAQLQPPELGAALGPSDGSSTHREEIASRLGELGETARPALPFLLAACRDQDVRVRSCATNALRKIAPDVFTNAPPP
jgi:hypothetical protein